ncbi:MAG: PEP-CTERM sorting domain-containing protein [Phycisphaeraceae bacterium]
MRKLNKSGWIAGALAAVVGLMVGTTAWADTIILVDFGHVAAAGAVPVYVDSLSQTWNQTTEGQKGTNGADMTNLKSITGGTTNINLVFNAAAQNWVVLDGSIAAAAPGGGYVEDWYRDFEGDGDGNPATYIPASNGPGTGTAPALAAGLQDKVFAVAKQSDTGTSSTLKFTGLNAGAKYTVEILVVQINNSGTHRADYKVNGAFGDAGATSDLGGFQFQARDDGASNLSTSSPDPYGSGKIMKWTAVSPVSGELVLTGAAVSTFIAGQIPYSVIRLTEIAPVPEPATIGLLAIGGAMMLPRRRRNV